MHNTLRPTIRQPLRRTLLAGILLVALVLRALIPAGFMPSSERPFSLEICPEGFPAWLLPHSHHHHDGGSGEHSMSDHCTFGGAAGAGPLPYAAVLAPLWLPIPAAIESPTPLWVAHPLQRTQQPRAPPVRV
jgi:hypothetical protein